MRGVVHRRHAVVVAWGLGAGAVLSGGAGAVVGGVAAGVVVIGVGWRRARARRRRVPEAELVALLARLSRSLRSGSQPRRALSDALELLPMPERPSAVDAAAPTLHAALADWARGASRRSERLVAGGLALGLSTGGLTADLVDALAGTVQLGLDARAEARALAATAQASARVLAAVPLTVAVLGWLSGAAWGAYLLGSVPGRACLMAGTGANALGLWWMGRIVAGAVEVAE